MRGGPGDEYEVSFRTGAAVLRNLPEEKYQSVDILIDKAGEWHRSGLPSSPERALRGLDAVWNAIHGEYGEDGKIQRILDAHGLPYTGSETIPSAIAMNKTMTKRRLAEIGVRMPRAVILEVSEDNNKRIFDIFRSFTVPIVVKPVSSGSSLGVSAVWGYDDLRRAISGAFEKGNKVVIEEYIGGREATCGTLQNFRGEEVYALIPVEIARKGNILSYGEKYETDRNLFCPAGFSDGEKKELQELAKKIHEHLELRHFSRSDFIVTPRGIYFLEVNTLPGLTENCPFPKSLEAVGCGMGQFVDHVLGQALESGL